MMEWIKMLLTAEFYQPIVEFLGPFGFVAGILLTMVEALLPPLPLVTLVTINVIIFGFLPGYLYSYIGTVLGTYIMFLILKRYGHDKIHRYIDKHPKAESLFHWIKEKGVFPILILMVFPFMPSFFLSGIAATAEIEPKKYFMALIPGKLLMVLSLSVIGVSIQSFLTKPIKSIAFIAAVLVVSLISKQVIGLYEKKVLRKRINRKKLNKENEKTK